METFSPETPEHSHQEQRPILDSEVDHPKLSSGKLSKQSRKKPLDDLSVEILKLVDSTRFATSEDIGAIIPMERNSLQVKLKTLSRQGFLARPAAQKYLEHERGRPSLVYALGRGGAQQLGVDYQEADRRFRFLEHALMTSKIYLGFLAGALARGADIERWEREPKDAMPQLFIPELRMRFANKPDGLLEYRSDKQNRFYIEAETGELPLIRNNPKQSSILRKLLYYRELYKLTDKQHPPFRVLFFIKDPDANYFDGCRELCRKIDPKRLGLNCFWFSLFDAVSVAKPEIMLNAPVWYTPSAPERKVLL